MADASETSSMSSPPNSPPPHADTIRVAPRAFASPRTAHGALPANSLDGAASQQQQHHAQSNGHNGHALAHTSTNSDTLTKPKRQRKPRESKDNAASKAIEALPKEKKPRKPRETKPKPDAATAAGPRKKQKTDDKQSSISATLIASTTTTTTTSSSTPPTATATAAAKSPLTPATIAPHAPRQPTLNELLHKHSPVAASAVAAAPESSSASYPIIQSASASHSPQAAASRPTTQSHLHHHSPSSTHTPPLRPQTSELMSRINPSPLQSPAPSSSSRPFSSGQKYDPIRGMTVGADPPRPYTTAPASSLVMQPSSAPVNRAPASSSIHSLIDPQPLKSTAPPPLPATLPYLVPSPSQSHVYPATTTLQQASSDGTRSAPPNPVSTVHDRDHPSTLSDSAPDAMDVDTKAPRSVPATIAATVVPTAPEHVKSVSKSPSVAAPAPSKTAAVIKGSGSGLLSSSTLFGGAAAASAAGTERKGVDIELVIPLDPNGGNTINIAQEIAKKYGRDAINPRAAAHRERLLQVAAAAKQIDRGSAAGGGAGSADDMSVDLMSEPDDSNVEMGGLDDEKSATGADEANKGVKKRKKKAEDYDKDDDFIDDTELVWQEQAAVAKGGFFVYSGPLIPEGQNAHVESSQPTRGTRGGRGRGRGRASAAAGPGATHASLTADKSKDPNAPTMGRGRGRGRGTGTTRKPRVTKADRLRAEMERAERERAAGNSSLLSGPTGAAISLAPSPMTNGITSSTQQHAQQSYTHSHPPLGPDREKSSLLHPQSSQPQQISLGKGSGSVQAV